MQIERSKTIQIFLPSGHPQGIRIAEITTRIVRVFDIPRSLVSSFCAMPEAAQVGLYFLIGEREDSGAPQVYIGQSGAVGNRVSQHNAGKDFWSRALVVVSLTNSLTNTHASYLEWLSIKLATQCGRYVLENGNTGGRPYTPAPLEADCHEVHETAAVLMATLGHPVFEPVVKPASPTNTLDMYFCNGSGSDGRGYYTEEGFVVLKGSFGRAEMVPSYASGPGAKVRARYISQGVIKQEGDRMVFQSDHLFSSPSTAAHVLMGRSANGWMEWRNSKGELLNELRQTESCAVAE